MKNKKYSIKTLKQMGEEFFADQLAYNPNVRACDMTEQSYDIAKSIGCGEAEADIIMDGMKEQERKGKRNGVTS